MTNRLVGAARKTSSTSIETNDVKLRDHMLHCPDEALKKALDRARGDKVDSISVADLLEEIKSLAVVRQSNQVNTLALMTAKQERDEPIHQDTKQAVLSKVEEMMLDESIAFVEARETGMNSVKILNGGGLTSAQAHRVYVPTSQLLHVHI